MVDRYGKGRSYSFDRREFLKTAATTSALGAFAVGRGSATSGGANGAVADTASGDAIPGTAIEGQPDIPLGEKAGFFVWKEGDRVYVRFNSDGREFDSPHEYVYDFDVQVSGGEVSEVDRATWDSPDTITVEETRIYGAGHTVKQADEFSFVVPESAEITFDLGLSVPFTEAADAQEKVDRVETADTYADGGSVFLGSEEVSPSDVPFTVALGDDSEWDGSTRDTFSRDDIAGEAEFAMGHELGFFVWKQDSRIYVRFTTTNSAVSGPYKRVFSFDIEASNGEVSNLETTRWNDTEEITVTDTRLYGRGFTMGGFDGFSFEVSDSAELTFDLQISDPIEESTDYSDKREYVENAETYRRPRNVFLGSGRRWACNLPMTVSMSGDSADVAYLRRIAGDDDVIDDSDLQTVVGDWAAGDVDDETLQRAISLWATGNPVGS